MAQVEKEEEDVGGQEEGESQGPRRTPGNTPKGQCPRRGAGRGPRR